MTTELLRRALKVLPPEHLGLRNDIIEYLETPNERFTAVGRVGRTGVVTTFSKLKEGDYLYLYPPKEE